MGGNLASRKPLRLSHKLPRLVPLIDATPQHPIDEGDRGEDPKKKRDQEEAEAA